MNDAAKLSVFSKMCHSITQYRYANILLIWKNLPTFAVVKRTITYIK